MLVWKRNVNPKLFMEQSNDDQLCDFGVACFQKNNFQYSNVTIYIYITTTTTTTTTVSDLDLKY